jgi:hypothetical protein
MQFGRKSWGLTDLARQLNSFAQSLKDQRRASHKRSGAVRETTPEYASDSPQFSLFNETELEWLETVPNL